MRTIWQQQSTLAADDLVQLVNSCDLVAELRDAIGMAGDEVHVRSAAVLGDGGGGRFIWSATSNGVDDGVFVIRPTGGGGAGRWVRVLESDAYKAAWWGPDLTGITPSDAKIRAADSAAAIAGVALIIPAGIISLSTSFGLHASVEFRTGAMLRPGNGVTITLTDTPAVTHAGQIFDISAGGTVKIARPTGAVSPSWWGADGGAQSSAAHVAITSGQAALVATTALWTAADAMKAIVVAGAGVAAAELHTTILSVSSDGKTATLANNAATTVSNAGATNVAWGFDDSAAIAAAINASAYGRSLKVRFDGGSYLVPSATATFAGSRLKIEADGRATIMRINPADLSLAQAWAFTGRYVQVDGFDFQSTDGQTLPRITGIRLNVADHTAPVFRVSEYVNALGGKAYDWSTTPFNCMQAIRNCYRDASAVGGEVLFDGLYAAWVTDRSTVVVINAPNVKSRGQGRHTGIICPILPAPVYPFAIIGLTIAATGCEFWNMSIMGSNVLGDSTTGTKIIRGVAITSSNGTALDGTPYVSDLLFDRVYFPSNDNGTGTPIAGLAIAIHLQTGSDVTIRRCEFENFVGLLQGFGYAILVPGGDVTIENSWFKVRVAGSGRHAVYTADPCRNVEILGCYFEGIQHEAVTSNQTGAADSYGLIIRGNKFWNCQSIDEPVIAGVVQIAGWRKVSICENIFDTDDTSTWGQRTAICFDQDQTLTNDNYDIAVDDNFIRGFTRHAIDFRYVHGATAAGNWMEDVGLDGASVPLHVQLSTGVKLLHNHTVVNAGQTLRALIQIDTTAPAPSDVTAMFNTVDLRGGGTVTLEAENWESVKPGFFRSGVTLGAGASRYTQIATPSVSGGVRYLVANPTGYDDPGNPGFVRITNLLDGVHEQRVTIRAYSNMVSIANNNHLVLASNNDFCMRAGQSITLIYDAVYGFWYEVGRSVPYEFAAQPPTGRYLLGDRSWNIAPAGNGFAGWVCTVAGYAVVAADAFPLTAAGGVVVPLTTVCSNAGKVYLAVSGTHVGGTPPTHTSGTASDGTTTWLYLAPVAQFVPFGHLQKTVLLCPSVGTSLGVTDSVALFDSTTSPSVFLDYAHNHPGETVWVIRVAGRNVINVQTSPGDTIDGTLTAYAPNGVSAIAFTSDGGTDWRVSAYREISAGNRTIATNTTIDPTVRTYFCDTSSGPFTVKLPASPSTGERHYLKDSAGNCGTQAVTLDGNGKTIDGASSISTFLSANYAKGWVEYNGSSWSIMG